jgi:hypothetical protein
MSIGTSGRIVIEVDPEVKRRLYSTLAREGLTLKDWFLREARTYVTDSQQLRFALSPSDKRAGTDWHLRSDEGNERPNMGRKSSRNLAAELKKAKLHEK